LLLPFPNKRTVLVELPVPFFYGHLKIAALADAAFKRNSKMRIYYRTNSDFSFLIALPQLRSQILSKITIIIK